MDPILLSLTHSDHFSLAKNDLGYQRIEQLAQNDSSLSIVQGLLEVEGALVQSLPTEKDCSQVDNNRVPLLCRSEPRNPLEMF
uniref:Uncharacterized protein n=1 Tax=Agrostis capillaris TaxID=204232 RepID=A0A7T0GE85_AGRCA|nr:hypothetical protein [Agrostis capillaris]